MTISRQFYTLVSVPFCLVIGFAIAVTYQVAALSSTIGRLLTDVQRTATLNQELTEGNTRQSAELRRQFEQLDPSFPESARMLAYRLGERYAEYLKLDIDQDERMTVETIKGLQDELSVLSMHVYELLREGRRGEAERRLGRLYQVEGQIRGQFDTLNGFQIGRLRGLVDQLDRTARGALISAAVLTVALVLVVAASVLLVRRRFVVPVRALIEASDKIRQGDLSARAAWDRGDELGRLTRGFNFMADSLAESYAGLERRVEERTVQLRETQEQLIQAGKMSAVGLLVSGVAHELNNPLASIMGATELARMELAAGSTTAAARALDDMDVQAERCRRIVSNLLQFVRKPEPLLEFVALNEAVDQVLQLREYDLGSRNIRIVRDFDAAHPVIRGDRDKIQQVVLNLLNNAYDAIAEAGRGGTITVRTRSESGKAVLDFDDDGPGFADAARAFDPFYTTKSPGKGTGLGLSVCYGIVREHQGEIAARNLERGAHVTVVFPIPDDAPPADALPSMDARSLGTDALAAAAGADGGIRREASGDVDTPAAGARQLVALVVDDEPSLLRLQAAFLEKRGIASVLASSGDEAVRYLREHRVDLVISDVRMPGAVDGLQLYQWVRRNEPRLADRFILVSGDVLAAQAAGPAERALPRIAKPFRFQEYERVVRRVLGGVEDA